MEKDGLEEKGDKATDSQKDPVKVKASSESK